MSKKYDRGPYGKNVYGRGTVRFLPSSTINIPFTLFGNLTRGAVVRQFSGSISFAMVLEGHLAEFVKFDPVNITFTINIGGGDTLYIGPVWFPDIPTDANWIPDIPDSAFWVPDVPAAGVWFSASEPSFNWTPIVPFNPDWSPIKTVSKELVDG
jgi:hypothetical protein